MEKSANDNAGGSRLGDGRVDIAQTDGWVADTEAVNTDPYRPCEGTWAEFVFDAKMSVRRVRDQWADRFDDLRDALRQLFRRKKPVDRPAVSSRLRLQ